MSRAKLAQLLDQRRAELCKISKPKPAPVDAYAASVKVNFVAVLERHFYKLKGAA